MKRFILGSLPILLLSAIAIPAVNAQVTPAAPPANAATIGMSVTPFNLVFLAYQGFFESEGIPKFNQLIHQHQQGQLTAEDLVKVAIEMRRLTPSTLSDRQYVSSVEQHLNSLSGSNN